MNRSDYHARPAHPGDTSPHDAQTEDLIGELLAEDLPGEEFDAPHLPSFSA